MDKKAADKLISRQGHGCVSLRALEPVILPPEGNTLFIHREKTAIGNCDAMGIARKISQYRCRSGERAFGIYHPLDLKKRIKDIY